MSSLGIWNTVPQIEWGDDVALFACLKTWKWLRFLKCYFFCPKKIFIIRYKLMSWMVELEFHMLTE